MRKHTRRKVWPLRTDLVKFVTEGVSPMDQERVDKLRMLELQALDAFRTGSAGKGHWTILNDVCNLSEYLARNGVGPEALEPCLRAQAALSEAHRRLQEHGRLGLTGPELTALQEAYRFHDLQRTAIPLGEYERTVKAVMGMVFSGHPGVKVLTA